MAKSKLCNNDSNNKNFILKTRKSRIKGVKCPNERSNVPRTIYKKVKILGLQAKNLKSNQIMQKNQLISLIDFAKDIQGT